MPFLMIGVSLRTWVVFPHLLGIFQGRNAAGAWNNSACDSPQCQAWCTVLTVNIQPASSHRRDGNALRALQIANPFVWSVYLPTCRGADRSLARPDWKNNWKDAIFRRKRRSLLPRRPGWTDNLLDFFLSGSQKLEFGRSSLFPSWSG